MRKFIFILLLLLCAAAPAAAQSTRQFVRERTGVPTVCPPGTLTIDRATGVVYGNTLGLCSPVGSSGLPVSDATAFVKGSSDATKLLRFEVDGFTAGATRVVTPPDADTRLPVATQTLTFAGPTAARTVTLPDANFTAARADAAQTFAGVQTFSGNILAGSDGGITVGAVGASRPNLYAYAVSSGSASNAAGEFRWGTTNGMTRILSGFHQLGSTVQLGYSGGDPTATAVDVGIARSAAGKLRVSDGSTGYGTISGAAAFAYKTAPQSIPYAAWTSVTWDAEADDTNAFHDNGSNTSRLTVTATTAGKLTFTCNVGIAANNTGPRAIRLYKNGTTIVYGPVNFYPVSASDPTNMSIVVDVPDAANADYYECQVYQGNSGAGALDSTSGRAAAHFSVRSY